MMVDSADIRLLDAIADGLPLVPRPYEAVARQLGISEVDVIARLRHLCEAGVIKRLGVIVRHHELGYRANAMSVWDVPDDLADGFGAALAERPEVTLCYRRRRAAPVWPYNLFCMIHGKDRATVTAQIAALAAETGLGVYPHNVLFSTRRFKQRGARYHRADVAAMAGGGGD